MTMQSDRPRALVVLLRTALAFLGAVVVWFLLVASFGAGPVGAALVGLAAFVAFTLAIAPAVGCVVLSHSHQDVVWLTPIAGLLGALGGVVGFHYLLQLLVMEVPSAVPDVTSRAQAAGSVVVWSVLSVSMVLVSVASQASKRLRIVAAFVGAGLAGGAGMWVRALGV